MVLTRDCRFFNDNFPLAQSANSTEEPFVSELTTISDDAGECSVCGRAKVPKDLAVLCKRCIGAKRGRHASDERCRLNRCECNLETESISSSVAEIIEIILHEPDPRASQDTVNDREEQLLATQILECIELDDFDEDD